MKLNLLSITGFSEAKNYKNDTKMSFIVEKVSLADNLVVFPFPSGT